MSDTPSEPPMWSLITVTYNSSEVLRHYWSQDRPENVEWIVVDNDSRDESVNIATDLGARVLKMDRNRGFSAANNEALSLARGTHVGFVNPDVRVAYPTLPHLERLIEKTGGLVAPQLENPDGSLQANGRGLPSVLAKVNHRRTFSARLHEEYVRKAETSDKAIPVAWCMGAAVCGLTETFRNLGGWNAGYFVYYEDHELGLRAWERGRPVYVTGGARWEHAWARETTQFKLQPWLHEFRSAARFYSSYPSLLVGSARGKSRAAAMGLTRTKDYEL